MEVSACLLLASVLPAFGRPYSVAPDGDDANPGTLGSPSASLRRAQQAVRYRISHQIRKQADKLLGPEVTV